MAGCSHNNTAYTYTHTWQQTDSLALSKVGQWLLVTNCTTTQRKGGMIMFYKFTLMWLSLFLVFIVDYYLVHFRAEMMHVLHKTFFFLEGLGKKTSLLSQTITFISSQGAYCSYSLYTISLLGWHLCCLLWSWAMSCHSFWLCYLRGTEHYLNRGSAVQYLSRPPVLNQTLCYCKDLCDTFVIQDHCITASVFHKRQALLMLR